jgi:hypothetical protein
MPAKFEGINQPVGDVRLVKIRTIIQNVDFYLAGRSAGLFIFGNARTKFKAYSVPQFKRYNNDLVIAAMESVFNPTKNSPLELINEQDMVQYFMDIKYRAGDKTSIPTFQRLIFWLLFGAAVNDEIYNNELSNIVDLAYCFDFNEKILRDWCKAVAFVAQNGKLDKDSLLQLDTYTAQQFFQNKS